MIRAKERVGYPTQKPLALLNRIIQASSDPGDVVLDPFCGCATACIAAEKLHRQWVGVDISPKAADLVRQRMRDELGMFYAGTHRTDIPKRTDLGKLPPYNGRIPDFPVTRSHPPASWPSAANSSICRTYRKTAGEESRRRSPVANRWMRP